MKRNFLVQVLFLGATLLSARIVLASAESERGGEYMAFSNGMYFYVAPTSLNSFRVWDCFTTSSSIEAFQGLSINDLMSATGNNFYKKNNGVLYEKERMEDKVAQNLIFQVRNHLARIHTQNEETEANRKFNQIFKIAAIVKRDQITQAAGVFEEMVESMLIVKLDKKVEGTDNTWVGLNAAGNVSKSAFFRVACPAGTWPPSKKAEEPKKENRPIPAGVTAPAGESVRVARPAPSAEIPVTPGPVATPKGK
ncbi:MAG: hypothetical protein K2X47_11115 [Bdellovibrionales bacterium]|nr:hypothetical protein [Bdellovibrionales bacterium]